MLRTRLPSLSHTAWLSLQVSPPPSPTFLGFSTEKEPLWAIGPIPQPWAVLSPNPQFFSLIYSAPGTDLGSETPNR